MSGRGEQGSVAVELAVIAPALVALLLLVVFAGRVAQAEGDVRRAASAAARAASLRQDAASGVGCGQLEVEVDTARFFAGGTVAVALRCTASMADVSLLGVPGRMTFVARSVEVIDRYRGGDQ
jgi:Flp pilus assembly protein TadG